MGPAERPWSKRTRCWRSVPYDPFGRNCCPAQCGQCRICLACFFAGRLHSDSDHERRLQRKPRDRKHRDRRDVPRLFLPDAGIMTPAPGYCCSRNVSSLLAFLDGSAAAGSDRRRSPSCYAARERATSDSRQRCRAPYLPRKDWGTESMTYSSKAREEW